MRWLFRTYFRSFYLLNATQFLGALNDNIFKLLVIYLLIHVKGPSSANTILSLAGAIFVIPFLLFSSGAGVLADKISKRTVIVFAKVLEVLFMSFSVFAVSAQWEFGSFMGLFLLASHSALFGPAKYGIIPELVDAKMVSRANGSITSFTYLAIILGTFLASFLADITNKNFTLIAFFCLGIAIIGLVTSLGIKRTEPQYSTKKINPFFLYEIYQTLRLGWTIPHLLTCIFGASFFLFVGAFTQLNIIPFAMQSLHLDEVGGGYLFLATAIGIAIGAVLSGRIAKDKVEPGISCVAGFLIALFFVLLSLFSSSLIATIIILTCLGIVGGGYLIPFDAYLQVNSPDQKRGQIIATANFFSFVGVLMAAICLFFINEKLGFSASGSFGVIGFLCFLVNCIVTGRLSCLFFPFFVQKILKRFRVLALPTQIENTPVFILQSSSWWDAILLFGHLPKLKILLPGSLFRQFPWINAWVDTIDIVPMTLENKKAQEEFEQRVQKAVTEQQSICLFVRKKESPETVIHHYQEAFKKLGLSAPAFQVSKKIIPVTLLKLHIKRKQISLTRSD